MIEIVTLNNGLKICMERLPFLRSVSLGIWVKNGSRYENPEVNGISHFIEHLLFKGTENRSAKDIADEVDSIGGQINAFTAKECTCYYTKTLDTHLDVAMDILADMFFNSKFDDEEIKKECKVILEEISMYEDSPEDLSYDILSSSVFQGSSLGLPILGTKNTITTFNHNTFKEYFKNQYRPENTVISIAGNFEKDKTVKLIEKYFSKFDVNKNFISPILENKYKSVFVKREKDVEQLHLNMAFKGVPMAVNETYEMIVINTILGGGMSSILFQKIREERGLAYSVYSQNSSYKDIGLFSIYSALNPENAELVVKIVLEEIEKIKNNKIDNKLLSKTKEQIKSNYILSLESSSSRMHGIGRSLVLTDRILTADQIIEKIDNVTTTSLEAVVNKIFDTNNLSISAVGNVNKINFDSYIRG